MSFIFFASQASSNKAISAQSVQLLSCVDPSRLSSHVVENEFIESITNPNFEMGKIWLKFTLKNFRLWSVFQSSNFCQLQFYLSIF